MVSASSALVAIIAATGLLQMCPAPKPISKIPEFLGLTKRDLEGRSVLPGVSDYDMNLCAAAVDEQQAKGGKVKLSDIDATTILVESIPPNCMVIATFLSGDGGSGKPGAPSIQHVSVDTLKFSNVHPDDRQMIGKVLEA